MKRITAIIAFMLASAGAAALDNAYFQSPNQPQINGQCARLKKSGTTYLWHCIYRDKSNAVSPGKKNIGDLTPAEKASMGFRGHVEADVSAAYKSAGNVGHAFFGVPVYDTNADRAAKKAKK